jgi:hypothetical protein
MTLSHQAARITFCVLVAACGPRVAGAQTSLKTPADLPALEAAQSQPSTPPATTAPDSSGVDVSIYPILLWVPTFKANTNVPPFPDSPDGPDLPGANGTTSTSLNGAALAGFSIQSGNWRVDADGIWAALGTERDRPLLKVDLDVIYGHASAGVKIYKNLYVTGGLRRVALKYDIQLEDRVQHFVRKPGLWDPLVGLAWHSAPQSRFVLHASSEVGGFGAGADLDLSAGARVDMKIVKHFGLTVGYSVLYLKISDTVLTRTFTVKQTLQGPVAGLGLYF